MKLVSIVRNGTEEAAILTEEGYLALSAVNEAAGKTWPVHLSAVLKGGFLEEIRVWYEHQLSRGWDPKLAAEPFASVRYAPPDRHPGKIWGVGANYAEKAAEMAVCPEEEPICFMKPNTTLIGPEDIIILPQGSKRVTAEAELAIIIGTACKNVAPAEALDYVGGYAASLDMTEKDIHARNPRFLGRAKSFDTFFSLGPELVTPDEITSLQDLTVETVLNGHIACGSHIANMIYSPAYILSFFSRFMTLLPGDILMTGTPGSVEIHEGDTVECRIGGFLPLRNGVGRE
ncbi:hypothetical protein AWM70_00900 [Paenibacillus yonginensis]|uniref:Fumarylacetoacetase-like C-terminal domain-containing protein n=1 Tax=Paenibacillus yonginensis TaxID=1462996 RepID=A0A1B1MVW8_9BACL|nr:fumarylacetoacetate hydrolase family protein [Paenibacillus yonginensis]ANS73318.1 hypothetical protein AWM70_00900 [Paenibacillus yonginensis]